MRFAVRTLPETVFLKDIRKDNQKADQNVHQKILRKSSNEGLRALVFHFCFVSLTAVVTLSTSGCFFSRDHQTLAKPVLVINGKDISTKEFADRLARKLKNYDALYAKDDSVLDRAKEETVQSFIMDAITVRYADENKIKISDQEMNDAVEAVRSKYPDDYAFRRSLSNENLPLEEWKKSLEITLLQKKIFSAVDAKLEAPSETEMKDYYEAHKAEFQKPARIRLRQIVLEKEDDAKRILEDLNKDGNLTDLAKKFSIAPEAENGGDTGWIEKGAVEVFDQAFKMNIGARSKIVKSPYGYHIFEVIKKEPEARLSFADAKAKIRARLMEAESQKAFTSWLERQVRRSNVKRDDAVLRAIKVTTKGS